MLFSNIATKNIYSLFPTVHTDVIGTVVGLPIQMHIFEICIFHKLKHLKWFIISIFNKKIWRKHC